MILLAVVLMIITALTRFVDIRKELVMRARRSPRGSSRLVLLAGGVLRRVRAVPLRADDHDLRAVVPGAEGGLTFPLRGLSLHWFQKLWDGGGIVDIKGAFVRSLFMSLTAMVLTVVLSVLAGLAFRKRFRFQNLLFYVRWRA